jgi:hypothetical protein
MLPASRSADDSLILRQVDRNSEGHACRARLEGRACHARGSGIDNPMLRSGPDERVPPTGEGHACRARRMGMVNPTWRIGRDERVPPSGPDRQVPPIFWHTC